LLELLKRDLGRGWQYIEIETVLIILLLKLCFGELFLFVTEIGTSFGLDSRVIVADHRCICVRLYVAEVKWAAMMARQARRVNARV
jgi:hypothetical protein